MRGQLTYKAMKRCRLKRYNFQIKIKMNKENETLRTTRHGNDFIADVRRSFTISYYFNGGYETVISVQATSKSEAIKNFWKQKPTADRINLIYDSFENYG